MIDEHTLGSSKASENLMTILGEPEYSTHAHRVLKVLSKYIEGTKALLFIPHKETRETALGLWRDGFVERMDGSDLPVIIKTHSNCVAVGYFRQRLKEKK